MGTDAEAHFPPDFAARTAERLEALAHEGIVERIWQGDHTVWKPEPREVADRLGWLRAPTWSAKRIG